MPALRERYRAGFFSGQKILPMPGQDLFLRERVHAIHRIAGCRLWARDGRISVALSSIGKDGKPEPAEWSLTICN